MMVNTYANSSFFKWQGVNKHKFAFEFCATGVVQLDLDLKNKILIIVWPLL